MKHQNARGKAYELIEEGLTDWKVLAECCLQYMSCDDIEDMLLSNDLIPEEETYED